MTGKKVRKATQKRLNWEAILGKKRDVESEWM